MRQQPGLGEHRVAHLRQVARGGVVAQAPQGRGRLREAQLGLVAQAEQRLLAALGGARAGDVQHLLRRQVARAGLAGIALEGAVAAVVAAVGGQRDEHLARVGDRAALVARRAAPRPRAAVRAPVAPAPAGARRPPRR